MRDISRQISLFFDLSYSHSTNLIKKNPESFESYRKYNQAGYDIDRLNEADGIITKQKEAERIFPRSY